MDNLTITDVHAILCKCTIEEVVALINFTDAEDLVLSLEDRIEDNLEAIVENIFTHGLA